MHGYGIVDAHAEWASEAVDFTSKTYEPRTVVAQMHAVAQIVLGNAPPFWPKRWVKYILEEVFKWCAQTLAG